MLFSGTIAYNILYALADEDAPETVPIVRAAPRGCAVCGCPGIA